MKYRLRSPIIEAHQWFKNGDHPNDYDKEKVGLENGEARTWTGAEVKALGWEGQVVRHYRNPNCNGKLVCGLCQHTLHEHGWIDEGENGVTVCPGDFVITDPDGRHRAIRPYIFQGDYEPVEQVCSQEKIMASLEYERQ